MRAAGGLEVVGIGTQVRTILVLLVDKCKLLSILDSMD